jgi:hypothetical protein
MASTWKAVRGVERVRGSKEVVVLEVQRRLWYWRFKGDCGIDSVPFVGKDVAIN